MKRFYGKHFSLRGYCIKEQTEATSNLLYKYYNGMKAEAMDDGRRENVKFTQEY